MPKHQGINLLSKKNKIAIRKAFEASRRTVTIDGKKFQIRRHNDIYLSVRPADGTLVPTAHIEVTHLAGLQSTEAPKND